MPGDFVVEMPQSRHNAFIDPPTKPPTGIIRMTVQVPASVKRPGNRPPPRWRTLEFLLYATFAAIIIPLMVWKPMTLSVASHPNYPFYQRRLSPGWLFGRKVDNSDGQYRSFRNNVPSLAVLAIVFLGLKRASESKTRTTRVPFLVLFSILMLVGLHGASIIKILGILSANYTLAKAMKGSMIAPLVIWVFNGLVLFANEVYDGYKFASMHTSLAGLDAYRGIYPRWNVSFNITMLRLISFSMDYYWACNRVGTPDTGSTLDDKQRSTTTHPLAMYSFTNYIAYVLYPPLYIAGPIMTFNDFTWQVRRPTTITRRTVTTYLVRFLTSLLTMEFILHFMYMVAIKDSKAWGGDSPFDLSMIGFWNLIIVWLKLLLPWRFFRLWALADGIDPPENMIRCMVNNYWATGFWRSWHRSYNLWIVRYIHIPLGGSKNIALTSFVIFTFVALWHDLSFKLLTWGWLVSLFILPELAAQRLLPESKFGPRPWYRHLCAFGAVLSILTMMSANLVGFVLGTEGMKHFIHQLTSSWEGARFLGMAGVVIFVGVQFMFEYREEEMRQGVFRKC